MTTEASTGTVLAHVFVLVHGEHLQVRSRLMIPGTRQSQTQCQRHSAPTDDYSLLAQPRPLHPAPVTKTERAGPRHQPTSAPPVAHARRRPAGDRTLPYALQVTHVAAPVVVALHGAETTPKRVSALTTPALLPHRADRHLPVASSCGAARSSTETQTETQTETETAAEAETETETETDPSILAFWKQTVAPQEGIPPLPRMWAGSKSAFGAPVLMSSTTRAETQAAPAQATAPRRHFAPMRGGTPLIAATQTA